MGVTDKWDVAEVWDKSKDFKFVPNISVDEGIRQAHYNFYEVHETRARLIRFLQRIGVYQYLRPTIKMIQKMARRH
jgi:hypothetical protein